MNQMNQNRAKPINSTGETGTTLVEIIIVLAIMTLLIAMGVPVYSSAIETAEEQTAISDIHTLSDAIDSYFARNGVLPKTLQEIGMDNREDPWGNPYIYKPVEGSDGTEPAPAADSEEATPDPEAAEAESNAPGNPLLSQLAKIPTTAKATFLTNAQGAVTIDIEGDGIIDLILPELSIEDVVRIYTSTLKLGVDDRPINMDYDLFSMGKDGDTEDRIDSDLTKDDIIRARQGNFVDRADKY